MTLPLNDEILLDWSAIRTDRATWEPEFRDLSEYVVPQRGEFWNRPIGLSGDAGRRKGRKVLDGTAVEASAFLAAVISSVMNGQDFAWFALDIAGVNRRRLIGEPGIDQWLQDARDAALQDVFNKASAGFVAASDEIYLDVCGLGTATMFIPEGLLTGDIFQGLHLSECYLDTDAQRRVVGLYRNYMLRAVEAFRMFGTALPATVIAQATTPGQGNTRHEFLHVVRPRRQDRRTGPAGTARAMPIESVYIHVQSREIIRHGGFPEFPYVVPRWRKSAGERYGRPQGSTVIGNIQLLNQEKITTLRGAQKTVDPPIQMPDQGFIDPIADLTPGGSNVYRSGLPQFERIQPILTGARPDIGVDMMSLEQKQIREAFFRDVLTMPVSDRMTATEVLQRRQEALRILGPMLGRVQMEFHAPLVDRVMAIMIRASLPAWQRGRDGALPLPPQAMLDLGGRLQPTFINPVSVAQRALQLDNTDRVLATVERMLDYDPKIRHIIDSEQIVRTTRQVQGAPADMLVDKEVYDARVAAEQERQAAIAAEEQAAQRADTAKTLAEAQAAGTA